MSNHVSLPGNEICRRRQRKKSLDVDPGSRLSSRKQHRQGRSVDSAELHVSCRRPVDHEGGVDREGPRVDGPAALVAPRVVVAVVGQHHHVGQRVQAQGAVVVPQDRPGRERQRAQVALVEQRLDQVLRDVRRLLQLSQWRQGNELIRWATLNVVTGGVLLVRYLGVCAAMALEDAMPQHLLEDVVSEEHDVLHGQKHQVCHTLARTASWSRGPQCHLMLGRTWE